MQSDKHRKIIELAQTVKQKEVRERFSKQSNFDRGNSTFFKRNNYGKRNYGSTSYSNNSNSTAHKKHVSFAQGTKNPGDFKGKSVLKDQE